MTLTELNSLSDEAAQAELHRVCGCKRWAREMSRARPFSSIEQACERAAELWKSLSRDEALEAFAAHPRIGERSASAWSQQEQKGIASSSPKTQQALVAGNQAYEARFGHVFLICATGKSADEMLSALQERLGNTPEQELNVARAEQAKIIQIRMEKLLPS